MERSLSYLCLIVAALVWFAPSVSAEGLERYLVLYQQEAVPADAARVIGKAGGALVYSYDRIGVVTPSPRALRFAQRS